MGFGLEYVMLEHVLEAERPWTRAVGRYEPTARNEPCSQLFRSAGFQEQRGMWVLDAPISGSPAPGGSPSPPGLARGRRLRRAAD